MAVTIKQIAEMCGVSRGTVDRVLNNRGKVKKETEQMIRKIAEDLGYVPNMAGKVLAANRKELASGVVLASEGNAFFDDVLRGIRRAETEIAGYGTKVILKTLKGYNVQQQREAIEEIRPHINALILNPISDPIIAQEIDDLVDSGICVITINTDIQNSKRMCYIGSDYTKGGETACGMLGMITGGAPTKIGVITGSTLVLGHNQRITGFQNVIDRRYQDFRIVDCEQTDDDDIQAFEVTKEMLTEHPEIDAIFIVAGGVYGVCRAVISMHLEEQMHIICFDSTPASVEMIKKGVIQATICQQPFTQGNKSVHLAFNYLVSGLKPEKEYYFVKNEIKILENL